MDARQAMPYINTPQLKRQASMPDLLFDKGSA
jgi:hypothetical protein